MSSSAARRGAAQRDPHPEPAPALQSGLRGRAAPSPPGAPGQPLRRLCPKPRPPGAPRARPAALGQSDQPVVGPRAGRAGPGGSGRDTGREGLLREERCAPAVRCP